MKKVAFLALLLSAKIYGGVMDGDPTGSTFGSYVNVEPYTRANIPSTYTVNFNTVEKKENFKALREYMYQRQDVLRALQNASISYAYMDGTIDSARLQGKLDNLNKIFTANSGKSTIEVPYFLINTFAYDDDYNVGYSTYPKSASTAMLTRDEVIKLINDYRKQIQRLSDKSAKNRMINANMENIKQDLYDCSTQIDSALAPEYKKQEFSTQISICFTILIGLLLVIFFYIVFKKSDNTLSRDLLSGNGLQFVTLFVLIIAVILFGILGIIQGTELATILSAISGYVLGKGTTKSVNQPAPVTVMAEARNVNSPKSQE